MTDSEALALAQRLYGPMATATPPPDAGPQDYGLSLHHGEHETTGLGLGKTWETAFADADLREWQRSHPFSLGWLYEVRLPDRGWLLSASCRDCKLGMKARVQLPEVVPADWQARATKAERAFLWHRVNVKGGYWARCSHRRLTLRVDRSQMEAWVRGEVTWEGKLRA